MKKILVIDDSETIRQQVKQALAATGYEIIEAVDGIDGLEKLRASPTSDMALCDVNMPRMNGLDMIAEVQRTGPKIPILMLTTEGQPSLIRRARESGAKGWIVKPFKPELLVAAVIELIESAGGRRPDRGVEPAALADLRRPSFQSNSSASPAAGPRDVGLAGLDLEAGARLDLDPHRRRAVGQRELERLELRAGKRRQMLAEQHRRQVQVDLHAAAGAARS